MAKLKHPDKRTRITVSISPELKERIETEQMEIQRRTGIRPSQSDVVVAKLEKGLAHKW